MKLKEMFLKVFKTKKSKIIFAIVSILVLICIGCIPFMHNRKSKVDSVYLNKLLEKSSKLITAELKITGLSEFKDEGITILNRSDFRMVYKARVTAGIDLKKVKINVNNAIKKVYINIPKATIQDVKIDTSENSMKFFDTKFALFNVNEKEDLAKAIELAEKDAIVEAKNTGMLELADKQSEALIKGILVEAVPSDYEFIVNIK